MQAFLFWRNFLFFQLVKKRKKGKNIKVAMHRNIAERTISDELQTLAQQCRYYNAPLNSLTHFVKNYKLIEYLHITKILLITLLSLIIAYSSNGK